MSLQKKLKNSLKCPTKLSVGGLSNQKSSSKSLAVVIEDTLSIPNPKLMPNKNLSIAGSRVQNKKMISTDKSNLCKKNIPIIKSSPILEVESTSKEKVFSPLYKKSSMELYQKLWLPLLTDSHDLTRSSLNGFSNNSDVNSFLLKTKKVQKNPMEKNWQKILCQLSQSSQQDIMEEENMATRKIRFFPTHEQKLYFNKCFGCTRYIYNKCLDAIKEEYKNHQNELKKKAKKGCIHMVTSTKKIKGSKSTKKVQSQCCKKTVNKYFCKNIKNKNLKLTFHYHLYIGGIE